MDVPIYSLFIQNGKVAGEGETKNLSEIVERADAVTF